MDRSDVKHENFLRIADKRTRKLLELIVSLRNFSNTSFYDFSNEEINQLFHRVDGAWNETKEILQSVNDSQEKKNIDL